MRFVPRLIADEVLAAARQFPSVVLTGPRRSGKTALLRRLFPKASYALLEDPDIRRRALEDPRSFLATLKPPVILDEIQNAPELFAYVRTIIDTGPRRLGQWIFTGSQEYSLMRGVTESMAGRAAILHLLPLSMGETPKVSLLHGGFPEALSRPREASRWFQSYLQTYIERDVRAISGLRDLSTFRRFIGLMAARHGQTLNKTDLAAPLGVSVPTVEAWLSILETTGFILRVPPYFENFGKRLIKSPKLYIVDSGLCCHLLGIESAAELARSPFRGALFEGQVVLEAAKAQVNSGRRVELYFFRDQQGLEVDLVIRLGGAKLWLVEAKASQTPDPSMAAPLTRLSQSIGVESVKASVVYHAGPRQLVTTALAPGVEALDHMAFVRKLNE